MITLFLTLVAFGYPAGDEAKADLKALQGKWSAVSGFDLGKPIGVKDLESMEVEIKDSTFILLDNKKEEVRWTIKLDPSQKPKVMRAEIPGDKKEKAEAADMIYEVKGDELKLAFYKGCAKKAGERPKGFEVKDGEEVQIVVLKRKK